MMPKVYGMRVCEQKINEIERLCKLQSEYQELRRQCQDFATALLDHTRTSNELEVMLNHDPTNLSGPMFELGERMHLNRLKLAIKLRQKKVLFPLLTHFIHRIYIYLVQTEWKRMRREKPPARWLNHFHEVMPFLNKYSQI